MYCTILGCGAKKKMVTGSNGTVNEEMMVESNHSQVPTVALPLNDTINQKIIEQLEMRIPPHKIVSFLFLFFYF